MVWVVVNKPVNVQPKTEIVLMHEKLVLGKARVLARAILQPLSRIIAAAGKHYFDAPDFVPEDEITNLK